MKSARIKAMEAAIGELGVKEEPPRSNSGPRVSSYLRSAGIVYPAPWCMAFVHWCFLRAGVKIGGWASVGHFQEWGKSNGQIVTRPFKGDVVCYDWDGGGWPDHVGIVVRVLSLRWNNFGTGVRFSGWVKTIEGNTSLTNDSNGGKVMYRYRWIKTAKFVRIPG